ncbi:MAG: adenylyltransferase/cytidyltransferase family protein, partial [Nitrososphaera sp.]|nr:adenylyltransferase/cytidyltransferase family protein [Nitrososphaera sp.]
VVVFPGSFNPFHAGHAAVAKKAQLITGRDVMLEICTDNVDKPASNMLDFNDRWLKLIDQMTTFTWADSSISFILRSNTPRFYDKMRFFSDSVFVVGFDTILRIGDTRYYENFDYHDMLTYMNDKNIRFLVSHRGTTEKDIERIEPKLRSFCSFFSVAPEFQKLASRDLR